MTSGVAGCTRESRSSHRFSNIGGDARSRSVRDVPEEAAMPRILPSRPAGPLTLQRLDPQVLLDRQVAELASVAGLLEAAERRERVERGAVDLDLTGADPARDALGALRVARPHAASEAVDRVVGDADRVVLRVVWDDR